LDTTERIKGGDGKNHLAEDYMYARTKKAKEITELTNKEILDAFRKNNEKYSKYKNIVLL